MLSGGQNGVKNGQKNIFHNKYMQSDALGMSNGLKPALDYERSPAGAIAPALGAPNVIVHIW